MKRYILDTGIASEFVNRRARVYEQARQAVANGDRIGVGTPVLGELWFGIYLSDTFARNRKRLKSNLASFIIWPFDVVAAEEFGRLCAELRKAGRPMQQVDVQTAAIALCLGNCTVVSKDSDFQAINGIDVIDWSLES